MHDMTIFPTYNVVVPPSLPQSSLSQPLVLLDKIAIMGGWEALHEPRTRAEKKERSIFSHARAYIFLPSSHYTIKEEKRRSKVLVSFGLSNGREYGRIVGAALSSSHSEMRGRRA